MNKITYQTSYGDTEYRYTIENKRGNPIAEFDCLEEAKNFLMNNQYAYSIYDNKLDTSILWK